MASVATWADSYRSTTAGGYLILPSFVYTTNLSLQPFRPDFTTSTPKIAPQQAAASIYRETAAHLDVFSPPLLTMYVMQNNRAFLY